MRGLFVTDKFTEASGGVARILAETASTVTELGVDIDIWCLAPADMPTSDRVNVRAFEGGGPWGYSSALKRALQEEVHPNRYDFVHIFGVWGYAQLAALKIASARDMPCAVSDYGMLLPWFWDYRGKLQKLKKSVYWRGLFRPALSDRTVWHSATPAAALEIEQLLPGRSIVTLPPGSAAISEALPSAHLSPERVVTFLGRIDPQKGIDILIEGFAEADPSEEWRLDIVGPEYTSVDGYQEGLVRLVERRGLAGKVRFVGPMYGADKLESLRTSWCLCVPSRAESPGVVSIEAAACGLPVILSKAAGLEDWESTGGFSIEPNAGAVGQALRSALAWSLEERIQRGRLSQDVARTRFSWTALGPRWVKFYESLSSDLPAGA